MIRYPTPKAADHNRRTRLRFRPGARCLAVLLFSCLFLPSPIAHASEHHGVVTFAGQPVPGATVTAAQATRKLVTTTGDSGAYTFPDLPDGPWTITVDMQCFAPVHADLAISPSTPASTFDLTLLPIDQILATAKQMQLAPPPPLLAASPAKKPDASAGPATPDMPKPPDEARDRAADGFLVNGSSNNAATSQYALAQAFGNQRNGSRSLYTGGLGIIVDNSALDARPYSLTGLPVPKASYNRFTGMLTFGGPIHIPRFMPRGPNFFLGYQWSRISNAQTISGLVPTAAQRAGDLSSQTTPILNPATGVPFPGNKVPVSAQARALLAFYPLPNLGGTSRYNYQTQVLNSIHTDALESRLDKGITRKDQLNGAINFQNVRSGTSNLFGFTDHTSTLGLNANINYSHRFSSRLFAFAGYRFSRSRTLIVPQFANRQNASAAAGISGNDQDPAYWGPPTLSFSSGIATLTDQQSAFNRNRTDAFSASTSVYRGRHNVTLGGDLRKQQFNELFQADPRGTLAFTAAATGSDLADFLIGTPDTSSLAFGNPDKYLRQPVYDLYLNDDFRVEPTLTINAGLRWEYGRPITETKNRLVNLDLTPGFTASAPVLASAPVGALTGQPYPASLIRPDHTGFEPRIGISWRPIPASTVLVRGGYGIYHDTSVYTSSALQLAQQAPLSNSLDVSRSSTCPITLASPFLSCGAFTAQTYAVDPNFRVGYAQTWQLSVQRDLPAALQATATYLGVKGTRGLQQLLPNTYPLGGTNPCPSCPSGFLYRTSGGDSTRESGQVQLRRRLRSGLTANLLYTYSHSIDNDSALGGAGHATASSSSQVQTDTQTTPSIAQDWRNLRAERASSTFDQRHLLNLSVQYTSGQGMGGGTLLEGWRGRLLKEWTALVSTLAAGSGLPETPIYFAAIPGAGNTGTLRPNVTGSSIYTAPIGLHLNAAAYTTPVSLASSATPAATPSTAPASSPSIPPSPAPSAPPNASSSTPASTPPTSSTTPPSPHGAPSSTAPSSASPSPPNPCAASKPPSG